MSAPSKKHKEFIDRRTYPQLVPSPAAPLKKLPTNNNDQRRESLSIVMGKIQMVLAEKRTSLSVLRTGIAVAAMPLSVTTVLVTLSRYYSWIENLHFLIPLLCLSIAMVALSVYLIFRAVTRIRQFDQMVEAMSVRHPELTDLIK